MDQADLEQIASTLRISTIGKKPNVLCQKCVYLDQFFFTKQKVIHTISIHFNYLTN